MENDIHTTDVVDVECVDETIDDNLPEVNTHSQVDAEFEYARNNIINIIQKSNQILDVTANLVVETEHPRIIGVYSELIKNLVEINKSIFDIREKKMKLKGEFIDVDEGTTINNNAIFVGSTEELLKSMELEL